MPPHPPLPSGPPRRWWAGAVVAVVAAAIGGGVVGGLAVRATSDDAAPAALEPADPLPSAAEGHAQDIALCTVYAVATSSIPKPYSQGMDLLPAVTALRESLAENPAASPEVRTAIADAADALFARVGRSGDVRTRGLAVPPPYEQATAQAAYDRAWTTCGLDEE